jgi:lysozyme family protein
LLGLPDSGGITEAVHSAVGKGDPAVLIARVCDERLAFLKGLKTWPVFGAGWGRRVAEVRAAALDMAARVGTTSTQSESAKAASESLPSRSAQELPPARASVWGVVIGLIATAGVTIAQWAQQPGARLATTVIVAAVLSFAGWLVWRRRHD